MKVKVSIFDSEKPAYFCGNENDPLTHDCFSFLMQISHNERDMAVTYSSVVTTRQQRAPRVNVREQGLMLTVTIWFNLNFCFSLLLFFISNRLKQTLRMLYTALCLSTSTTQHALPPFVSLLVGYCWVCFCLFLMTLSFIALFVYLVVWKTEIHQYISFLMHYLLAPSYHR